MQRRRRRARRRHGQLRRCTDARDTLAAVESDPRASPRPQVTDGQCGRPDATRSPRASTPTDSPTPSSTPSSPPIVRSSSPIHGYPWLIHRLAYRRPTTRTSTSAGYKEEGTTTTPFDMVMLNDLDRFHLVMDVIDRVPGLGSDAGDLRQHMVDERSTVSGVHPTVRRIRQPSENGPGSPETHEDPGRQCGLVEPEAFGRRGHGRWGARDRCHGHPDRGRAWHGPGRPEEIHGRGGTLDAVGHRIVHGGTEFTGPIVVDDRCAVTWRPSSISPRCTSRHPSRHWTSSVNFCPVCRS